MERSKLVIVASVLITALVVSGVWYALAPALVQPKVVEKPKKLETVTVLFDWVPSGKYVPFYAAIAQGYYEEQGLAVSVIRGQGSTFAATQVSEGKVDFSLAEISAVIVGVSKGMPIKSVFQWQDRTPAGSAVFKQNEDLKDPKRLNGHSWGCASFSFVTSAIMPAIRQKYNVTFEYRAVDPAVQIQAFLDGKFDVACLFYDSDMPVAEDAAKKMGKEVVFISFDKDWGLNIYGYTVVANRKTIEQKPEMVRGFVAATLKGLKYAMDNPDAAVNLALRLEPLLPLNVTKQQWLKSIEMIKTPYAQQNGIGIATKEKGDATLNLLAGFMKLSPKPNFEDIWTNDFVPRS